MKCEIEYGKDRIPCAEPARFRLKYRWKTAGNEISFVVCKRCKPAIINWNQHSGEFKLTDVSCPYKKDTK